MKLRQFFQKIILLNFLNSRKFNLKFVFVERTQENHGKKINQNSYNFKRKAMNDSSQVNMSVWICHKTNRENKYERNKIESVLTHVCIVSSFVCVGRCVHMYAERMYALRIGFVYICE